MVKCYGTWSALGLDSPITLSEFPQLMLKTYCPKLLPKLSVLEVSIPETARSKENLLTGKSSGTCLCHLIVYMVTFYWVKRTSSCDAPGTVPFGSDMALNQTRMVSTSGIHSLIEHKDNRPQGPKKKMHDREI